MDLQQLDELRAFIANPRTGDEELRNLLRNAKDQLTLYDNARRVIHDAGQDGWSYGIFQESLRVGSDTQEGTVTKEEWDRMRQDARERLRDRSLRDLNQGRKTFEELRALLQQEIARRESGSPPAARPAATEPKKSRWKFRKG